MKNHTYKGFTIKPKLDFGSGPHLINGKYVDTGWVVTDGFCNVMPGATWSQTIAGAKSLIRAHLASKGDATVFWEIVRATYSDGA